jgi:hypothetical protein
MFRSYDHLQADIYFVELTLLTTDPWSHTRNKMQTPKIKIHLLYIVLLSYGIYKEMHETAVIENYDITYRGACKN